MDFRTGARGPFFEDLTLGEVFETAPSVTLTDGRAAVHQAIAGDRLRLPLDSALSDRVTGHGTLAHPAYVWDTVIGQSTLATRNVKANLFYRGLAFGRAPVIGDTLRTTTKVVALRQNSTRPGRGATGLAGLHIMSVDQHDRPVLDFHRCAMIPLREQGLVTGHNDDMSAIGRDIDPSAIGAYTAEWDLTDLAEPSRTVRAGDSWMVAGGDVVTSAPELARLTLNIAAVHHDSTAGGGRRLVFGGHTIAIALSQVTRDLPNIVTVVAWHGCDHLGPVYEGDTLRSTITVEGLDPKTNGGSLVDLRCHVAADDEQSSRAVLDWRFVALVA